MIYIIYSNKNTIMELMFNQFGFTKEDIEQMQKAFCELPNIEKVLLFGSRAMNRFKN